jgi:uncharacterized protein (TIGR00725 family)
MSVTLWLDAGADAIRRDDGRVFDAARRAWVNDVAQFAAGARDRQPIDAIDAVRWLARGQGTATRVPVGVIGPRDADPSQLALAERIGQGLARMALPVLCGGREGVMEAVCRGVRAEGGLSIALTPDVDPSLANPHAHVVIASGIGEARNALIARAALCLVAIGNSFGTLSEVALGRHFGKRVIGLAGAADVAGVVHVASVDEALALVARTVLALD